MASGSGNQRSYVPVSWEESLKPRDKNYTIGFGPAPPLRIEEALKAEKEELESKLKLNDILRTEAAKIHPGKDVKELPRSARPNILQNEPHLSLIQDFREGYVLMFKMRYVPYDAQRKTPVALWCCGGGKHGLPYYRCKRVIDQTCPDCQHRRCNFCALVAFEGKDLDDGNHLVATEYRYKLLEFKMEG